MGMREPDSEEQKRVSKAEPTVFVPVKGAWGRAGATQVYLGPARKGSVRAALREAWQYRMEKNAPKKRTVRKPVRKGGARRSLAKAGRLSAKKFF